MYFRLLPQRQSTVLLSRSCVKVESVLRSIWQYVSSAYATLKFAVSR